MRHGVLALAACFGCGGGGSGNTDGGATVDAQPPAATCAAPALYPTTSPTVVGDGSAASCTAAALQTAVAAGGAVTFNCGSAPVTITVTTQIMVTKETVIDGGGTVALSGGNSSRIMYLDSDYNTPTPRLVVQRLSFKDGKSSAGADDTAGGGAAIYRDGGSLTVIDSKFENNHAPMTGQDLAGGAIYGFGGGDIIVAGSTFTNNSASDGGAIGSLNGDLTIINSTFTGNAATGTGGNPGNGGCGGALYQDGRDEATSLCGVTIDSSTAGAIGGGVFRVSNDHTGSFAMAKSTINNNRVTSQSDGNAGGLYLEGLALTIDASTISRNQAFYNGGIWINTCSVSMLNTTIAENTAFGSNGGGMWLGNGPTGMIKNCTIANNHSTASGQVAGGIFGAGLTLVNTIVANNTAQYTPTCDKKRTDGSGNLQWPDGSLCTTAPTIADPQLDPLAAVAPGGIEVMQVARSSPAATLGTDCPPTDQVGNPRDSATCTAGAMEFNPLL